MIENVGGGAAGGPRRPFNTTGPEDGKQADGAQGEKPVSGPQKPYEGDRIGRRIRRVKELRGVRTEKVNDEHRRLQSGRLEGREILKKTAQKIVDQEL